MFIRIGKYDIAKDSIRSILKRHDGVEVFFKKDKESLIIQNVNHDEYDEIIKHCNDQASLHRLDKSHTPKS